MEKDFIKFIEMSFPFPIAATFRRIRMIDEDDIINRHDSYGDLFESILKFIAISTLQDYRSSGKEFKHIDSFLKNILHPSLGHWNEIIRLISLENTENTIIAKRIAELYYHKISPELRKDADFLANILQLSFKIRTFKDIFDLLIIYRNKVWKGHGAKISKEEYKDRLESISTLLTEILKELRFIAEFELFYVDEIVVLPTNEFKHKAKLCSGDKIEPKTIVQGNSLSPSHVYLKNISDQKEYIVDLYPLLVYYHCKDCKTEQIFFFNDYRRNRLEFLSYSCGHFIYPEMLPDEFEKFFKVPLSKVDLSEELEKMEGKNYEKTEKLIYTALNKISTNSYLEALEYLQLSESLIATWQANYYLALILMKYKATPNEIRYHLNQCEQLEPDNALSSRLSNDFNKLFANEELIRNPDPERINNMSKIATYLLEEKVYNPEAKSVYYYMSPKFLRDYSPYFWILIPSFLLITKAYFSESIGLSPHYFVTVLKICMVVLFVLIVNYISNSMKYIFFSMNQQLTSKTQSYFIEWYKNELKKIFGDFRNDGNLFQRLNITNKHNKSYFLIVVILWALSIPGSIFLTCHQQCDTLNLTLISFDYLVIWGTIVPAGPIIFRTYFMLKNYSSFPLKPVLSSVDAVSFNKVGRMILMVSLGLYVIFISFTMIGYFTFSRQIVIIQLVLFYFFIYLGCIWTIITPYHFSKSLSRAKDLVLFKFREHLEERFTSFISNPTVENLENYQWFIRAQRSILKIKTKAISNIDNLGLILINILIFLTAIIFPLVQFKVKISDIVNFIATIFT
jgi:hypothetical protein